MRSVIFLTPILAFLLLSEIGNSQPQPNSPATLNLNSVIREVMDNNNKAAAMRYMEKAAVDNIGPSGAWDDPMLMIGVQNMPTSFKLNEDEMTMRMLGIKQNIPYSGYKGLDSQAARARAKAAKAETRAAEISLATAAADAYLDLFYRKTALGYMQSQRELQNDIITSISAKIATNQANQAELSAAQADLWRLEAEIISNEQQTDAAFNSLYALMGKERPQILPELAAPEIKPPTVIDTWLDLAKSNYPALHQAQNQTESYRYSAASARRMRWPMLGLSASYGFRSGSSTDAMTGEVMKWDDMISLQADISLPIFSGRQQGKMASSMDAMRRSSESEADQIWRDARAELTTLYSKSQRLSRTLSLYSDRIIPADNDALSGAFAGFTANTLPYTSLLTYAMNIYRDRMNANQIEYQLAQTLIEAGRYTMNTDNYK